MDRSEMTLRLPIDLDEELRKQAKSKGISRHALILQLLWKWYDKKK